VANEIAKRSALEKRERILHEQLAEDTRRLQIARAHVRRCEQALEQTLNDLHDVQEQRKEITGIIESMWNGSQQQKQKSA
jgi:hypothetical protein